MTIFIDSVRVVAIADMYRCNIARPQAIQRRHQIVAPHRSGNIVLLQSMTKVNTHFQPSWHVDESDQIRQLVYTVRSLSFTPMCLSMNKCHHRSDEPLTIVSIAKITPSTFESILRIAFAVCCRTTSMLWILFDPRL